MVTNLDENGIEMVKAEIEYININDLDVIDELSDEDRAELFELINELMKKKYCNARGLS